MISNEINKQTDHVIYSCIDSNENWQTANAPWREFMHSKLQSCTMDVRIFTQNTHSVIILTKNTPYIMRVRVRLRIRFVLQPYDAPVCVFRSCIQQTTWPLRVLVPSIYVMPTRTSVNIHSTRALSLRVRLDSGFGYRFYSVIFVG